MKKATLTETLNFYKEKMFKTDKYLIKEVHGNFIILNYAFDNWMCIKTQDEHLKFKDFVSKQVVDSIEIKTVKDLFIKAEELKLFKDKNISDLVLRDFRNELFAD